MSKDIDPSKRIEFLAKRFNLFDEEDLAKLADKDFYLDNGEKCELLWEVSITSDDDTAFAIYTFNKRLLQNEGRYLPNNIRVADFVFIKIVQADPTPNKEYVQWMLETFSRLIKINEYERAIRFITEDLWLASEYLEIFHKEKNKPKFRQLTSRNEAFKNISDSSNINQYRDLSQLFDAIDPYFDKDAGELEKNIRIAVKLREGLIPYEDREVIVFNPTTIEGSRLFSGFTNWCTSGRVTSFNTYINNKTSLGKKSKLYVIIYKKLMLVDDYPNALYQLHFETSSYMDKRDKTILDMSKIISNNVGLSDYFYSILIRFAKANNYDYQNNVYVDALNNFGFMDIVFDVLPNNVNNIRVCNERLDKMPDISQFSKCKLLYIVDSGLAKLHPSVGDLKILKIASFSGNKLKSLPKSISKLTKLEVLNIKGNKIKELPENIKYLDKNNGGSLEVISVDDALVDEAERLLPNVSVNPFKSLTNK